jgi:cytochrome c biogenesis protein CcdA
VLPFVFARTGQPFMKSSLPLLAGMALTFALVASLAAVGGGWVVQLNQYGRWLALVFVALFGLTLLLPQLAERLTLPLVAAGSRLSEAAGADARPRPGASFLIGVATGLLWGPVINRRRAARGKHRHHPVAAGLRGGCRHFPRGCVAAGR